MTLKAHYNGIAETLKRLPSQRSNIDASATLYLDGYTMSVELRRFTPAESKIILQEHNSRNRPLDRTIVQRYARLMELGNWQLNGETIIFGEDGILITGQHRLHACVTSGVNFYALVVTNVATQAFATCDRGKPKTNGQILGLNGEFNATTLAAAINLVYALKTKQISVVGLNTNARLEPLEMAEFVARHPQIRRSISLAKNLSSLAPPSMIGAAHFVASELDLIQADAFLESLNTGQNLEAGNPILLLRERFIQNKGTIAKLHTNYLFALTIKAWNAYHAGTQIKNLRLRTDGPNPEPFPTPI